MIFSYRIRALGSFSFVTLDNLKYDVIRRDNKNFAACVYQAQANGNGHLVDVGSSLQHYFLLPRLPLVWTGERYVVPQKEIQPQGGVEYYFEGRKLDKPSLRWVFPSSKAMEEGTLPVYGEKLEAPKDYLDWCQRMLYQKRWNIDAGKPFGESLTALAEGSFFNMDAETSSRLGYPRMFVKSDQEGSRERAREKVHGFVRNHKPLAGFFGCEGTVERISHNDNSNAWVITIKADPESNPKLLHYTYPSCLEPQVEQGQYTSSITQLVDYRDQPTEEVLKELESTQFTGSPCPCESMCDDEFQGTALDWLAEIYLYYSVHHDKKGARIIDYSVIPEDLDIQSCKDVLIPSGEYIGKYRGFNPRVQNKLISVDLSSIPNLKPSVA